MSFIGAGLEHLYHNPNINFVLASMLSSLKNICFSINKNAMVHITNLKNQILCPKIPSYEQIIYQNCKRRR